MLPVRGQKCDVGDEGAVEPLGGHIEDSAGQRLPAEEPALHPQQEGVVPLVRPGAHRGVRRVPAVREAHGNTPRQARVPDAWKQESRGRR